MGKCVLITGGTSGIGYALAKKFAEEDYKILIAASNKERLLKTKNELEETYGISVHIYEQDLSKLGAAEELYKKIKEYNIEIDVLVNNAGYGAIGATESVNAKKDQGLMILNMITLTELCKLFLNDMYQRKQGKILNVSSTGAFQPGPYTATYYASKSYVLSYSRAIRREAAKRNVQVCTLCPGTTNTEFFQKTGKRTPAGAMSPDKVAEYAYHKLMKNREIIVPGIINRILRIVPVRIKIFFVTLIKIDKKNRK